MSDTPTTDAATVWIKDDVAVVPAYAVRKLERRNAAFAELVAHTLRETNMGKLPLSVDMSRSMVDSNLADFHGSPVDLKPGDLKISEG